MITWLLAVVGTDSLNELQNGWEKTKNTFFGGPFQPGDETAETTPLGCQTQKFRSRVTTWLGARQRKPVGNTWGKTTRKSNRFMQLHGDILTWIVVVLYLRLSEN